ncbi:MAG: transcription termination factor Rho [Deltaproteobacteria bacterium]|nr:transcription termination factor Rho [Deltaproteobacteria bacterium]
MSEETKEETQEETKPVAPEFKKPLDKMTAVELKEVAMEIPGAVGVTAMSKVDLLASIREYYGLEDESEKKKAIKKIKIKATVKELKGKITELKEKKAEIRKNGDPKQITVIRKRLNRLKKQIRKAAAVK